MLTYWRVGLDNEAVELLLNLSVVHGKPPALTLKDLLSDMLYQDPSARGERTERPLDVQGPKLH